MKKSFLYFVPAALLAALLFAGCPQEADDDGDGSGVIPSYQKDVDGIAVAFADGAPVVYLKDNLHLGNSELVIPAGKTLDLRQNVTIDQIGPDGKLVVVGDILFNTGEYGSNYDILLYKSETAKIIATESFYLANVDDVYIKDADGSIVSDPTKTVNPNKHIKTLANQVIKIATFNIAESNAWETYIAAQQETDNADYIPVQYNGTINKTLAETIGKYGSGRMVYIIGDVTIEGNIDLTQETWYPAAAGGGQLYNEIPDAKGSLLIGGAVVFNGGDGQVSTDGGLTVLGTLTTKGDRGTAKVNAKGPLVTYLLRLDSGGGGFGGSVTLIGSLPSKFGGQAVFDGAVTARGTVIIDYVTFNKKATFKGPVEFTGPENSVVNPENVVLENTVTVTYPGTPVDVTSFDIKKAESIVFNSDYQKLSTGTGTFSSAVPVTFNGKATFGTIAIFARGAIFNNDVVFTSGEYHFGTASANGADPSDKVQFAKVFTINSGLLSGGSIGLPVTFNSNATFVGGSVNFLTSAEFKGELKLDGAAGTFGGNASFAKKVSFAAGSQVTIGKGAKLNLADKIVLTPLVADAEGYVLANGDGVVFADGKLTIPTGKLDLGSASINIKGGGEIVIGTQPDTGIVFGTQGTPVAYAGEAYITAGNYEIKAGTSAGGTLVGFFGTVASDGAKTITLSNTGIKGDGSGSQAVFRFAGSNTTTDSAVGAPVLLISNDFVVDGVTLDLAEATDKLTAGTIQVSGNPVITLKGGEVTVGGGTVSGGAAGGIRIGAGTAVFGALPVIQSQASTVVNDGYLVGLGGKLVAGTGSGTISGAGISVGSLGVTEGNTVSLITTSESPGFAVYYETVQNAAGAKGIVNSTGATKRFNEVVTDVTGGSVAVFAGTITAAE